MAAELSRRARGGLRRTPLRRSGESGFEAEVTGVNQHGREIGEPRHDQLSGSSAIPGAALLKSASGRLRREPQFCFPPRGAEPPAGSL